MLSTSLEPLSPRVSHHAGTSQVTSITFQQSTYHIPYSLSQKRYQSLEHHIFQNISRIKFLLGMFSRNNYRN